MTLIRSGSFGTPLPFIFSHPLGVPGSGTSQPTPTNPRHRASEVAQLAAGVTISPSFSEARLAPEATVAVTYDHWRQQADKSGWFSGYTLED